MSKIRTVVSPNLVLEEGGMVSLVNLKSDWTTELLETVDVKKEFKSKNGLDFLAVARIIEGAPTLDLSGGGLKNTCELAFFVRVGGEWYLVANTHITLTTDQLQQASGEVISYIKNTDIELAHPEGLTLDAKEAKRLVSRVGPSLGCGDHTYEPVFPKNRLDICAVRRMAENGSTYGFDTIYLVWKTKGGQVRHRELTNSRSSKDYINIKDVREEEGNIVVEVGSGGSYSGSAWDRSIKVPVAEIEAA